MAETCSDATIQALCCVYGDYVNIGSIKTDDAAICGGVDGTIVISSVVVSEAGPWGYNPITQTLTIPNNNNLLRFASSNPWQFDSVNQTNQLSFVQVDGFASTIKVHSVGTTAEKSNSFRDNGVGIEIIHSEESGGSLPTSPESIPNAAGQTGRMYRNHHYYVWFNDAHGRFTHWWNVSLQAWTPIRVNRNVLIVHPAGGANTAEFTTLSGAYTYLVGLPASPGSQDPNQDAAPSATNRWTIFVYGSITETATINARDHIDVFFMPGARLVCTANSGPAVLFDGTSTIRTEQGRFAANWTSLANGFFAPTTANTANIVRAPASSNNSASCIRIKDMSAISLTNLGLYFQNGSDSFNHFVIQVDGDCTTKPSGGSTSLIRDGVYLLRINAVMNGPNNTIWPNFRVSLFVNHTAGVVNATDCAFVSTPDSIAACTGVMGSSSPQGFLNMNQCIMHGARSGASHGLWSVSGPVFAQACTIEAYGDSLTGYGSSAANVQGPIHCIKCIFRIVQAGTMGSSPNALTVGLASSSACIYMQLSDNQVARFEECAVYGNSSVATGVSITTGGTWADTKLVMHGCIVKGTLASIASTTGTTTNTKRIYNSHLEGPIAGTPFGCAAATTTYQTSFLV